jgi:hypothetical protein
MARRATIQLKVHGQVVQSIPLDLPDIECVIEGLRQVTPLPSGLTAWSTCSSRSEIAAGRLRADHGDLGHTLETLVIFDA